MFYENIQTVNNLAGAQQSVSIYTQELNSEYALLIEAESGSGQVILSKNSNKKMFPASMTKIMTDLVVIKSLPDLNELIFLTLRCLKNYENKV
nr:hypothetical protein [Clostridioides mangenotii]